MTDLAPALVGPHFLVEPADDPADYRALRRRVFVEEQGLFERDDRDERDDDPRTVVLVARSFVGRARPAAAKDVSMAGMAGTLGMLAEASGCGALLDVARVPRPAGATAGDWLACFPGFAMLTAGTLADGDAGPAVTADCGELVTGRGVRLRWPDGEITDAVDAGVTGLGTAA